MLRSRRARVALSVLVSAVLIVLLLRGIQYHYRCWYYGPCLPHGISLSTEVVHAYPIAPDAEIPRPLVHRIRDYLRHDLFGEPRVVNRWVIDRGKHKHITLPDGSILAVTMFNDTLEGALLEYGAYVKDGKLYDGIGQEIRIVRWFRLDSEEGWRERYERWDSTIQRLADRYTVFVVNFPEEE
jgi:hypothetical protein